MSLNGVFVLGEGRDKRIWEPDEKEEFSVKSFHSSLMRQGEVPTASPKIWRACVPPKGEDFRTASWFGKSFNCGSTREEENAYQPSLCV